MAVDEAEEVDQRGFDAGRLTPDVIQAAVDRITDGLFGLDGLVKFYYRPYLYLDNDRIVAAELDPQAVRERVADALTLEPGIHLAVTRRRGLNTLPNSKLLGQIRNNYHEVRAGDIYVVQDPYWFNFDKGAVVAAHGSPWNYDTHVPVIFVGDGIPTRVVHRRVQPADVAPTIAALLGMTPPASSQGTVLVEVLQ